MKNKYIKIALILGIIFFSVNTYASDQAKSTSNNLNLSRDEIRQERHNLWTSTSADRADMKRQIEIDRQNIQDIERTATSTQDIKIKLQQIRQQNKDLRDNTLAGIKAEKENMRTEVKDTILKFKDAKKVKLSSEKKLKLNGNLNNAFSKLTETLSSIQTYDLKIKDKITEDKSKGLDTSKAEADIVVAEDALQAASGSVSGSEAGIKDAIASSTSISVYAVKASIRQAAQAIQNAREKFKTVIDDLENAENEAMKINVSASSTEVDVNSSSPATTTEIASTTEEIQNASSSSEIPTGSAEINNSSSIETATSTN